jgi:tetratricopeptide (TPR) repeat protein
VVKHDAQIADVTGSGYMPPWLPETGYGEFADVRRLSPEEIRTLAAWIDGGTPEGDPAHLPALPEFPQGWQMGEPDLVLTMPEEYSLQSDGKDVFRWFVWPVPLEQKRFVRGFEFRPGNARIVHHARILFDTTGRSLLREQRDSEPGFSGNMRLGEMKDPSGHWLGWTPGKQPVLRPTEFAWELERGSDVVLDTHLVPSGKPERLRSTLGLYFSDEPPTRTPVIVRLGAKTMDIPPGDENYTITDEYTLPVAVEVLNVYPHAHYLGKQMKGWAELPDGRREWLIYIKEWDFNWQDEYRYAEPVALPPGTVIKLKYTYDNSAENPRNPSQPPKRVTYGWKTEDEMGDMWLQVVPRIPKERVVLQKDFELKEMRLHIASFLKTLPDNPDDYDTHHTLATCYSKTGETALAIRHFREAIRIKPSFAIAHHNLGIALQAEGESTEAVRHIRQAIELGVSTGRTWYYLGEAYRALGDLNAAVREYRHALDLDPQNAETHNILGVVLRKQGDATAAMQHYRRAIYLDPSFAPPHYNLANALRTSGDFPAAFEEYRSALELDPGYVSARNNLALLLRLQNRHDEALEHFREVARLAPEEPGSWLNLGAALAQTGKVSEAVTKLREAVRLDPDSPGGHKSLGLALKAVGKIEEAAVELREAARLRAEL